MTGKRAPSFQDSQLLRKKIAEIRELDSERQSLVYNHHHELIAASDTIAAVSPTSHHATLIHCFLIVSVDEKSSRKPRCRSRPPQRRILGDIPTRSRYCCRTQLFRFWRQGGATDRYIAGTAYVGMLIYWPRSVTPLPEGSTFKGRGYTLLQ